MVQEVGDEYFFIRQQEEAESSIERRATVSIMPAGRPCPGIEFLLAVIS
jgi:hypothetical protein